MIDRKTKIHKIISILILFLLLAQLLSNKTVNVIQASTTTNYQLPTKNYLPAK